MRKIIENAKAEFMNEPIKTTFWVLIGIYSLVYVWNWILT